jgi:hypothetical protein
MNKKRIVITSLIFVLSLMIIPAFARSFEGFGTDKTITDPTNDVWAVRYSPPSYTYGKTDQYPYIDIVDLTVDDSDGNYTITLELLANFNSSAITGSGSYIQIWIDANNTGYEDVSDAYFAMIIGSTYPSGFVYCVTNKGAYQNTSVNSINNNFLTWTMPQSKIDPLIDNILGITSWQARAWAYYAFSGSTYTEYAVDVLADPEQDQTFQNAGSSFTFPSIPGYSISIISLASISIIVTMIFVYNKKSKK